VAVQTDRFLAFLLVALAAWLLFHVAVSLVIAAGFEDSRTEIAVPLEQVARIRLLSPERRLPPSARNVRLVYRSFLDQVLFFRLEAPLGEARAWAAATAPEARLTNGPIQSPYEGADWWMPDPLPAEAEGGEDRRSDGHSRSAVELVLIPQGDRAIVWGLAFSD
jgi:hypothetical protein